MPSKKAPVLRRPLQDMTGAALYTGFSERQFRRWIEERKLTIPVVKVNGRNYFDPDDLDRLVAQFPREIPGRPDPDPPTAVVASRKSRRGPVGTTGRPK